MRILYSVNLFATAFFLILAHSADGQSYYFSTLAGSAGYGKADGTGSAAQFDGPESVAVDSVGNVYVADAYNNTIRKITPAGAVSTLAGMARVTGSADGVGTNAQFYQPEGVTVDSVGNVYVADHFNFVIRKITPAGVVTTLAGLAGSFGNTDGTGSAARFSGPLGVTVDGAGNVYVTDDETIRKITSAGVVTTLAGLAGSYGSVDGMGSAARFHRPSGIGVDNSGYLYVADTENDTIRKITSAGVVSTLAGSAGNSGSVDGMGSAAQFNYPSGLAVDGAGNVCVADTQNNTIRKITSAGVVTTLAGLAGTSGSADGAGGSARFYLPDGVAVDGSSHVYVADTYNNTIRKVSNTGAVSTLAGSAGGIGSVDGTGSAARFYFPYGVAVDSAGNLFVADSYNSTIRKITPAGVVTTLAGQAGNVGSADGTGSNALFYGPESVAVDSSGNVYVADSVNNTIRRITSGGVVTTFAGSASAPAGSLDGTGSAAQFDGPQGVAVDSAGNVYVADTGNHTIRKITSVGVVSTLAGSAGSYGSTDGTGSGASFNYPHGVAVDCAGNIYVADTGNDTIRQITSTGVVSTLAGSPVNSGSTDGIGSAALFNAPIGVAVDSAGNVYVVDYYNVTIRRVTPTGTVTTLGGSTGNSGNADGAGSSALFYGPQGVAVDLAGNLYVADTENDSIRKGILVGAPRLTIMQVGNQTEISWDTAFTGFMLQTNATLTPAGWGDYSGSTANNRVTNGIGAGTLFYRLKK